MEEFLTYSISRHRGDLIELVAQSVDHKILCLSFFTRPLLGIPQRSGGFFYASSTLINGSLSHTAAHVVRIKENLPE
ncbi:hypothetical protein [Kosakonia oryziphila]|uniref:hypothetical protein n=1 Tax=Kosakonia oryziphila TaxID=1005667 RepID=UPI001428D3D4|nr:hypothetical protein [Kosakonia oryziphila]